jgi:signal peptidase I
MSNPAPSPIDGDDPGAVAARPAAKNSEAWKRSALEWIVVVASAVVVALFVQATSFQAFFIPTASMQHTLDVGDRVLVNKWSYRLHPIHRGDIVVFTKPKGELATNVNDLIKRVIGLPGETLTIADNQISINGQPLEEPYLPKGTSIQSVAGKYACTPAQPCKIPPKEIWVMGDNRTNSEDSRYFGPIPESSVVGRAFFRIWPVTRAGPL